MEVEKTVIQVRELIAHAEIEKAINVLFDFYEGTNGIEEIIIQSSIYQQLKSELRAGIIRRDEAYIEINNVKKALLDIVRELKEGTLQNTAKRIISISQDPINTIRGIIEKIKERGSFTPEDLQYLIQTTISKGYLIYNEKRYKECAIIYLYTAKGIANLIDYFFYPSQYGMNKERMMLKEIMQGDKEMQYEMKMGGEMRLNKDTDQGTSFYPLAVKKIFNEVVVWSRKEIDIQPGRVAWELRYAFDMTNSYINALMPLGRLSSNELYKFDKSIKAGEQIQTYSFKSKRVETFATYYVAHLYQILAKKVGEPNTAEDRLIYEKMKAFLFENKEIREENVYKVAWTIRSFLGVFVDD